MTADDIYVLFGFAMFHLAMLSSFGLITGLYAESWGLAPKRIIFSRAHKLGVLAGTVGVAIIVASHALGLLNYGIFLGVMLMLLDVYLTYRAFRSARSARHRKPNSP